MNSFSNNQLRCTLHGDHAWQLHKYVTSEEGYEQPSIVIIIQYGRYKTCEY